MSTQFRKVKVSTTLTGPIKEHLRKGININWNEYELDTLAHLIVRLIEGYSMKQFIPTHLELYEIVGWDLACASSTVQGRIKKAKEKILNNPIIAGVLIASGTEVKEVNHDMFFTMLMNITTIAQQQSNILNLPR